MRGLMRTPLALSALLAVLFCSGVDGGHVISRLAQPLRHSIQAPAAGEGGAGLDLDEFSLALSRLSRGPHGKEALGVVLGYLERVRDHPRDGTARRVCLWEPGFRAYLATSDGGLQCLRAAGFGAIEKDRRGTPFLVMRRIGPHKVRALIAATTEALAAANAAAPMGASSSDDDLSTDGESDAPSPAAPPSAVGSRSSRSSLPDLVDSSAGSSGRDGDGGNGESSPERALVEQISSMISGLIRELERPGATAGGSFNATLETSGDNTSAGGSAPVHFRVYRSPGFPGFPGGGGGGGLPFLPGGLGGLGSGQAEGDEDGEVAVLERRLRAADLPPEAEDVANRELKRLRRMSPMHSEYSTLVDYLEWLADVPWNKTTQDQLLISDAKAQLEADHFGMEKVKARILEYLAVAKLKGDIRTTLTPTPTLALTLTPTLHPRPPPHPRSRPQPSPLPSPPPSRPAPIELAPLASTPPSTLLLPPCSSRRAPPALLLP